MCFKHLENREKAAFQGVFLEVFHKKSGRRDLQKGREYSMIEKSIWKIRRDQYDYTME